MESSNLQSVQYLQVGVTERKCMKILPNAENKKTTDKLVIGDKNGVLQSFEFKKDEMQSIFKVNSGAPISKVQLGGALDTEQDKIFIASGSDVRGYSKKGKMFLDFNSNMTEPVANLYISGSDLFVSGIYMFNHFSDCVDKGYYLSTDKIMDILCLPNNRTAKDELVPVLACNDRNLRILKGCKLSCEIEVPGVPECLISYNGKKSRKEIIYGTSDGKIGHVNLSSENKPQYDWLLQNSKNLGGISCLAHYDFLGDGVDDLLVGRDDGTVEIFSYEEGDEPSRRFSHTFKESVTSVQGGMVGALGKAEVLTSTYSGWVMGLTKESQSQHGFQMPGEEQQVLSPDFKNKLGALKTEVEILQKKVGQERSKRGGASKKAASSLLRITPFDVNDTFKLNPVTASYQLTIELKSNIDYVVVQTDVPIDLLEQDHLPAVVSRSREDAEDSSGNNYMLVTYRCQANTSRLQIQFRSIEGHFGHIQAYIVPKIHIKCAALRRYHVCPLSLHQRSHSVDSKRPFNLLKLTGPFSIGEIHSWVCFCLPDVPERPPPGEVVTLHFTNTFLETQLECVYRKGEGIFKSDNISTISILKDTMSKQATGKKIALNIHYEVHDDSIPHTLDLLHPKMNYQFLLVKKVNLLDALQELQTHEGNMEFFSPEYQHILEDGAKLKSEFANQPSRLERLYGMITDLYIDKFKFKGVNVKSRVPKLLAILDSYDLANLKTFFAQNE